MFSTSVVEDHPAAAAQSLNYRHGSPNAKDKTRNDINQLGGYAGPITVTPSDASTDEMVPGDIATAKVFGQRVTEALGLLKN